MTDRQGNFWVLDDCNIYKFYTGLQRTHRLAIEPREEVKCLFADQQGHYWVATKGDQALRIYNSSDDRLLGYLGSDGRIHQSHIRFGVAVYCMYQANDGTLWLGTKPDGIFRLRPSSTDGFRIDHLTSLPMTDVYHIEEDRYGRLWVASRGDYENIPSRLYLLEPDVNGDMLLTHEIDTPVADLDICGDSLYFYGSETVEGKKQNNYGILHLKTLEVLTKSHITLPEGRKIRTPYGIKVHPQTRDLYIMDATNYVSSGVLFCFDKDGNYKWDTATGDIPGHAAFLTLNVER